MGKRKKDDSDARIMKKLKRLERKLEKRRKIREVSLESSSSNERLPAPPVTPHTGLSDHEMSPPNPNSHIEISEETNTQDDFIVDEETLLILGDKPPPSEETYDEPILEEIAKRWQHVVSEGLKKEAKQELQRALPENCKFPEAPEINPELKTAIPESVFKRDCALRARSNQLAKATACIAVALDQLVKDKNSKKLTTKLVSDAGRLMSELIHSQTMARRSLILYSLSKDTKEIIKDVKQEKYLFGSNLQETMKTAKVVQKTGSEMQQARKTQPAGSSSTPRAHSVTPQTLNYRGPPRKPGTTSVGRARTFKPYHVNHTNQTRPYQPQQLYKYQQQPRQHPYQRPPAQRVNPTRK